MLVEKKEMQDDESKEHYVEAYYDSSHLIKTLYIPARNTLFVIFKKGQVYSYSNISAELYAGLEMADSQGVYFNQRIKANEDCQYYRMYKLYEFETKDIITLIEEKKKFLDESKT